ncbi:MAG TPA: hypothetical protein VFG22_02620 [Polyangiales bacterium]|nr:hypothetical protein [Polyangiales bacterium]
MAGAAGGRPPVTAQLAELVRMTARRAVVAASRMGERMEQESLGRRRRV